MDIILGHLVIAAFLAAVLVFIIHCNFWYWPRRRRMTRQEREREDAEMQVW